MNLAQLLLRVTGDDADAKRTLREVSAEMEALANAHFDATIDVSTTEARAKLDALEKSLVLLGARTTNHRVKVDIDQSRGQLSRLRKELDHALTPGAVGARAVSEIVGDIGSLASKMGGMTARAAGLAGKLADVGGAAGEVGTKMAGSLAGGIASVVVGLIQFAAISVIIVLVLNTIAGLAIAVGSALFYAALGAGALAIAFGAMMVPVLIGAILGFKGVVDAIKSVKEAEQEAEKATERLARAQEQRTAANKGLADANKAVSDGYIDALRAQQDAVDAVKRAELDRADALLGIEDADIRRDRAKLALKEGAETAGGRSTQLGRMFERFSDVNYRGNPKDFAQARKLIGSSSTLDESEKLDLREKLQDLAHAEIGVKRARLDSKKSADDLSRSQERLAEFTRDGVKAYEPYANALERVADAQKASAKANKEYLEAQGDNEKAQKKLKGDQVELGRSFIDVGKRIKDAFGPASQGFVKGLLNLGKDFASVLEDPGVQKGLTNIGAGFREIFNGLGKVLRTKEVKGIFASLGESAGEMLKVFGKDVFPSFLKVILRIAEVAAPLLVDMFGSLGRLMRRWERKTEEPTFARSVRRVVSAFRRMAGLARDAVNVVLALFKGGREEGDDLVRTLSRMLRRWEKFLNSEEGQKKIKEFIQQAIEDAKTFWNVLKDWYSTANDILGVIRDIVDALPKVAKVLATPGNFIQNKLGSVGINIGGSGRENEGNFIDANKSIINKGKKSGISDVVFDSMLDSFAESEPYRGRKNKRDDAEKRLRQLLKKYNVKGFASGGLIPGMGGNGDDQIIGAEGGEYMINRDAVRRMGTPTLDAINRGEALESLNAARRALKSGRGSGISQDEALSRLESMRKSVNIELLKIDAPPATYPSPEWVAKKLSDLASNRGT